MSYRKGQAWLGYSLITNSVIVKLDQLINWLVIESIFTQTFQCNTYQGLSIWSVTKWVSVEVWWDSTASTHYIFKQVLGSGRMIWICSCYGLVSACGQCHAMAHVVLLSTAVWSLRSDKYICSGYLKKYMLIVQCLHSHWFRNWTNWGGPIWRVENTTCIDNYTPHSARTVNS